MLHVFFDASALIKRYSLETGTDLLNEVFQRVPQNRMSCSTLSILEIAAILVRKRNDGRLSQSLFDRGMIEFRAELIDRQEFSVVSLNDELLLSAMNLIAKHNLNATDAVILRSVLNLRQVHREFGGELLLWTSDKRLVRAAQDEGITVFDPEQDTADHLRQLLEGLETPPS